MNPDVVIPEGWLRIELKVQICGDELVVVVPYKDDVFVDSALKIAAETARLRLYEVGVL